MGHPFIVLGTQVLKVGSCYPRSENPDLGHPFIVVGTHVL